MKLYHLSEEANIQHFIPRPSKKIWNYRPYVWAISEAKVHNYLFPRNCPRICIGTEDLTPLAPYIALEPLKNKKALLLVPQDWEARIRSCSLYQYEFDPTHFSLIDAIAGYYVSERPERPIAVRLLKDCLMLLEERAVEVQLLSHAQLRQICTVVVEELEDFSVIRWDYLGK
ncbi:MAG: DUF6886 family protein [Bacteroidota bacterium]